MYSTVQMFGVMKSLMLTKTAHIDKKYIKNIVKYYAYIYFKI